MKTHAGKNEKMLHVLCVSVLYVCVCVSVLCVCCVCGTCGKPCLMASKSI